MEGQGFSLPLEDGLDLRQLITSSSLLNINIHYDNFDTDVPNEEHNLRNLDMIGEPVKSFVDLEKELVAVDTQGYVKKKILEESGGFPLHEGCTVSIAFSAYWENELDPFDVKTPKKPLTVDLKDNGLLPGVLTAVKSMLVGELALFLLSHEVAYGELGIPPRIKPKAKCVFFINLIKSILTPADGPLDFAESNSFTRIQHEVKMMYMSGNILLKANNFPAPIQLFKKGVNMLHECRLADEDEEILQRKLLIKLYTKLVICYNNTKQPLKACTACNELNRLDSLWNNGKLLYQNAKALRMIGAFDEAKKKLQRAMQLNPDNAIKAELALVEETSKTYHFKWISLKTSLIDDNFKEEVNKMIKHFKENTNQCKLTLPPDLNPAEMDYIREVCIRENLFCNQIDENYFMDKEEANGSNHQKDSLDCM